MFVYKIYTHTASEPNLLKMRLKQSVIERKARVSGPAGLRRHERLLQAAQRKQQKQNSTLTSTYNLEKTKPHSYPPQIFHFQRLTADWDVRTHPNDHHQPHSFHPDHYIFINTRNRELIQILPTKIQHSAKTYFSKFWKVWSFVFMIYFKAFFKFFIFYVCNCFYCCYIYIYIKLNVVFFLLIFVLTLITNN